MKKNEISRIQHLKNLNSSSPSLSIHCEVGVSFCARCDPAQIEGRGCGKKQEWGQIKEDG